MKASLNAIDLIKRHEGLRLHEYCCPGGYLTIGWGHRIEAPMSIGLERAEQWFKEDIATVEKGINSIGVVLNQNQFDALASFVFNFGINVLKRSTLLKKIQDGDPTAPGEFGRWIFSKKTPLPGLIKRRAEEALLFIGG